jgi:tetratricopeptide (TPR) repeat protein
MESYEEALALYRGLNDLGGISGALNNIGELLTLTGQHTRAEPLFEEAVQLASRAGNKYSLAGGLESLGYVALLRDDLDTARDRYREALTLFRQLDDKYGGLHCLAGLAGVAALNGSPFEAGRLWTIVITSEAHVGLRLDANVREGCETIMTGLRTRDGYQAGVEAGRNVPLEQALQEQAEP